MLLTVCKPKGSQAIKSIKETGDIGSFPLLYLEIGAKLQCVYNVCICAYIYIYAVCYLYDGIFWGIFCCCSALLSLLPYRVLQLSYVFHYKANSNCRSK